jgi:hypothetical protein
MELQYKEIDINKDTSDFVWKIAVLVMNIGCFYGYILNNHYQLVTILMSGIFLIWLTKIQKIVYRKSDFFYLILVIVFLISAVTSSNRTEALKYVFALSEFALLLIALQSNRDWVIPFLKCAFVFSGSHFFSIILYKSYFC